MTNDTYLVECILAYYFHDHWSVAKIAEATGKSVAFVQQVIDENS